jgi:uncharacterized protein (DUF1800 family)
MKQLLANAHTSIAFAAAQSRAGPTETDDRTMNRHSAPIYRSARIALLIGALLQAAPAFAGIDRPMDEAAARAMLNRFGYGADRASLQATTGITPRHYLDRAIRTRPSYPPALAAQLAASPAAQPLDRLWPLYGPGGSERLDKPAAQQPAGSTTMRSQREVDGRQMLVAASTDRLLESANSDNPGHEALLNFWLNHFSIHGLKQINKFLATDYTRQLQRAMREDSFAVLLKASFFHPAMQIYLDNNRSVAADSRFAQRAERMGRQLGINENLARELLELHTLGIDSGYTQADVQALARIITGAGVLNNRLPERVVSAPGAERIGYFFFDPNRHDFGEKRLLGRSYPAGHGIDEIRQALDQLASHPRTAEHIAGKLARRFLADEPPPDVVRAMAAAWRNSGGRISATLAPLLDSPAFAASLKHPGKFKEPVDFVLSAARAACDGQVIGNGQLLWRSAQDQGQAPFMRTTPDGYGSQEADWLSPPAMAKRIRLAQTLTSRPVPLAIGADGKDFAPCRPTIDTVRVAVGQLGTETRAALAGLSPQEEMAALLASPEFMRR